jgi:adenylate cyclase
LTEQQDQDWSGALVGLLHSRGVEETAIEDAKREGQGALLALFADQAFVPGNERLTRQEVAERAGIDIEDASAFWRALGFADVPDDARMFTEVDVEVMQRVAMLLKSGFIDRELALQMTRVMGRAAAQVAAAQIDTVRAALEPSSLDALPTVLAGAPGLIEDVERWLIYVFRRHFVNEIKRVALQLEAGGEGMAVVGFADLVGFTGISQQLDEETLAAAVARFESTAVEIVGAHGGRLVKMIGDEVMFETPTVREGALIALDLVEKISSDETLPDVRVGLAAGPAIRNQGDLFGTAPNLASRLVDAAYPGSVLASDSVHDALEDEPGLIFKSVRPQHLKGFGRTRFWKLAREGHEEKRRPWQIPVVDDLLDRASQALER